MSWRDGALERIRRIHQAMPTATADELRKELRRHSGSFSGGTSWGGKVWPKACKEYISQRFGIASGIPQKSVEDSPLFRGRDDIVFPFRNGGSA